MKFLITKELEENFLLKKLVFFVISILILFLISDMVLHHYQIGLTYTKASETIFGNSDNFIESIPFDTLLEHIHIDIFSSLLTLMLINVVYISVKKNHINRILIHVSFLSAIFSILALLFSFWFGSIFLLGWIVLFFLWHLVAIFISCLILIRLYY